MMRERGSYRGRTNKGIKLLMHGKEYKIHELSDIYLFAEYGILLSTKHRHTEYIPINTREQH